MRQSQVHSLPQYDSGGLFRLKDTYTSNAGQAASVGYCLQVVRGVYELRPAAVTTLTNLAEHVRNDSCVRLYVYRGNRPGHSSGVATDHNVPCSRSGRWPRLASITSLSVSGPPLSSTLVSFDVGADLFRAQQPLSSILASSLILGLAAMFSSPSNCSLWLFVDKVPQPCVGF